MKKFVDLVRRLAVASAVWLVMGLTVHAMAGQGAPGMATVLRVTGNARYSDDHRTWRALKKGERLKPGCLIQTAELSSVDLVLGESAASSAISISLDGQHGDDVAQPLANAVRVMQDSVLGLDKLPDGRLGTAQADETQLDLQAGQIIGSVQRMGSDSKYEIRLPNGVAGVRSSSRYALGSNGSAHAISGSIVIVQIGANGSPATKVVTAGQKFDPATGAVNEAPGGQGSPDPIKLDPSSHSAPASNPPTPGPSGDLLRTLPSRRF